MKSYACVCVCADRVEGNYCGCGTWYEASVLEVIPKVDADTIYYIKYTVDGEEETVSGDCIRRFAAKSIDSTTSCRTTSTGTDEEGNNAFVVSEDEVAGEALEGLSLADKSVLVEYTPKLWIGDDGNFVPELYEGMMLCLVQLITYDFFCSTETE
jgi:hypothetical protein